MGNRVALIRGINVGRAKRVAMADLRAMVEDLGYRDVRTVLNSGNVVFTADDATADEAASRIEDGLAERLGVPARVTVLTGAELSDALDENPLADVADDPSRLLLAVLADRADRASLEHLLDEDWAPEALAVGPRVAYLWCPDGIGKSRLNDAVNGALGDGVTARNLKTMDRLRALLTDEG